MPGGTCPGLVGSPASLLFLESLRTFEAKAPGLAYPPTAPSALPDPRVLPCLSVYDTLGNACPASTAARYFSHACPRQACTLLRGALSHCCLRLLGRNPPKRRQEALRRHRRVRRQHVPDQDGLRLRVGRKRHDRFHYSNHSSAVHCRSRLRFCKLCQARTSSREETTS